MANSTYSFGDLTVTISHPSFGQYVATNEGIGSITTTMTTDRTAHDTAADGSIMISKIPGRNGTITMSIQQTSALNRWLLKLYNYLETASASEWAGISITQRAPTMQDQIVAKGVSFQKLPDRPYQAQGQQVTWNLMAADIQQNVV